MQKIRIKQATKQGFVDCKMGGVLDLSYPSSKTRRGRVQEGGDVSPTITADAKNVFKVENLYKIRKLTPRECWRIMGFSDDDFNKAQSVVCETALYKQAGNSICVCVLEEIFKRLINGK